MSQASLEPYLRARAVNPSLIPANRPRTAWQRENAAKDKASEEFIEFLGKLVKLAALPVTLPIKWIHNLLTSPLTISVILKLILLLVLTVGSAIFSIFATAAFWYSWGTGGAIELEGWLVYGSKSMRTPHTLLPLPMNTFQEDLRYDVQVEMELVRPTRGGEEMGNFMLSLELRSARDPNTVIIGAAQPSLPPPPLALSILPLPSLPTYLLPPCVIPWPFRSFCPSRLLGYHEPSGHLIRKRRAKGSLGNTVGSKDVVLLRKDLMEGVVVKPARAADNAIGSAFVSIGREDTFPDSEDAKCKNQQREVKTTGWVVIRFIPKPYGIRWLMSAHPLPPLILLPPISLGLTLSSAIFAFVLISYFTRSKETKSNSKAVAPTSEQALLEEKSTRISERQERDERREADRRRREWEEVESSALGGLRRMPEERKRTSTVGGSETTGPSVVRSFGPTLDTTSEATEESNTETGTETETGRGEAADRGSPSDESWEEA